MTDVQHIQYGDKLITYTVKRTKRKTLAIRIHPTLEVEVRAPLQATDAAIAEIVHKRAEWILRNQRELEKHVSKIPKREYVSGESHYYLGKPYQLEVIENKYEDVKRLGGRIRINTQDKTHTDRIRDQLNNWYREESKRVFAERLEACYPKIEPYGAAYPTLKVRLMKTRWGSCSSTGNINLNTKLIQVAKPYIDYVMLHELCHLVEHNHSPAFYALMTKVLPDWCTRREELNHMTWMW